MLKDLEVAVGYQFQNPDLLTLAMTHKSASFEAKDKARLSFHNEKLEFLGDAVVDLLLSEILMENFPQDDEGQLSKKRASLVNESVLAKLAAQMGLATYLILGRGELASGGEKKPRLLASAFEALVGAIFLDSGYNATREVARKLFQSSIAEILPGEDFSADFKTRFQELLQGDFKSAPVYKLVKETGPSHDRLFEVEVSFRDTVYGLGRGRSKKAAEQEAAREALDKWLVKKDEK